MPNWLILAVLAVAIACSVARSLRRANATIAAAEADLAKREGDRA